MSVIEWLLDSDPSIRWQVMRDLTAESDATVASERSRVAAEGWGARLLDLQGSDGHWGGAAFVPRAWTSTQDTLQLLRDLGADPTSDRVRRAIGQVRDRCWNCDAPRSRRSSFHSTICVLEGLLEYETATGQRPGVTGARLRGQ